MATAMPADKLIHGDLPQWEREFIKSEDVAQYKDSDFLGAIRVDRNITLPQAYVIAKNDPRINYFVYVKAPTMVLPTVVVPESDPLHLFTTVEFIHDHGNPTSLFKRIFRLGDTVFFKKEGKWLGDAPGLADVYVKRFLSC